MALRAAGIKDVAKAAGVSVGTVSNVLNRPDSVSEARRAQVLAAIAELGYVPNDAARQLKAGVSRTVGLIALDTTNPFYGELAVAAEDAAEELELGLFVANSHGRPDKESFYLAQFQQQRARGILVTPAAQDLAAHRLVASRGTPVVLVDAVEAGGEFCSVAVDDVHGAYLAVSHLAELGRRRITVLGGPGHYAQVARRFEGARRAAADHPGVELDYVEPQAMTVQAGRAATEELLAARGRPEAIFAMNDLLAVGVLQALVMRRGIRVPDDVALIGYDDIAFCGDAVVPLSSVRQPSQQLGREAMALLEAEVAEQLAHRHRAVLLKPELVVRESTVGKP